MGRTITWNQDLRDNLWAPDDPASSGLKLVLLPGLGIQAKGIILLPGMLWAGARVGHTQAMESRGHPESREAHPRVNALGIKRHKADRFGEHQEGIRLALAGLGGEGSTAEQPYSPAKQ